MAIGMAAIAIAIIAASYSYYSAFTNEHAYANRVINELVNVTKKNASISAYLDNKELATEVVNGLVSSEFILGATLESSTLLKISAGKHNTPLSHSDKSFELRAPFNKKELIGSLLITTNQHAIDKQAKETALVSAIALASQSLLIGIFALFLADRLLTNPIVSIAKQLDKLNPGSDRRLHCPATHEGDEIGKLTRDINHLLTTTENTLKSERELRKKTQKLESQFRLLFEKSSAGIVLIKENNKLQTWNPAFALLLEPSLKNQQQLSSNNSVTDFFENEKDFTAFLNNIRKINNNETIAYEAKLKCPSCRKDKWIHCLFSSLRDDDGNILIEGLMYDITDRIEKEKNIQYEADHDALTGLLNRRAGERMLQINLDHAIIQQKHFTLLLIDLDKFKPINDTFGHDAGDEVLCVVSKRLKHTLRNSDISIRWGGDEFVIAAIIKDDICAEQLAQKILDIIIQPISLSDNNMCEIGASIGISLYPDHANKLEDLIECADQAMYKVKQEGRNNYIVYSTNLK